MLYSFLQKPVQNRKVVTSHVVTSDCSAEVATTPKSVSALADQSKVKYKLVPPVYIKNCVGVNNKGITFIKYNFMFVFCLYGL